MNYRLIHIAAAVSVSIWVTCPAVAQEKAFFRCAGNARTRIASWEAAEIVVLTSATAVTSFRIESSTNVNGVWMTNRSYAVLQASGKKKTVYIPAVSNIGDAAYSYSTSVLNKAEGQILIGLNNYILAPYLSRNMMPSDDPNINRGLKANINLNEVHSNAIPSSATLSQVWVYNGDEVWNSPLGEQSMWNVGTLRAIARNGPEWWPNIWETELYVDLVVEIVISDVRYLIKSTHVLVEFTQ